MPVSWRRLRERRSGSPGSVISLTPSTRGQVRTAALIEQPALRGGDALVEDDAHLALGDDAGADVEDERIAGRGGAEADRVGADAALDAARRRDAAAEAVVVHRRHEGESLPGRRL